MKQRLLKITTILLFCLFATGLKSQNTDAVRPQIWSNLYVGYDFGERFSIRSGLAYNVLLSDDQPWNEITFFAAGVYNFHRFMEANAGLYIAGAQQTEKLRSYEYRPYAGFRIFSNNSKRWFISNLSRFEVRTFIYSDKSTDVAFRSRNRTDATVSLTQTSMIADHNLFLFGYFEVFYNFEQEVRERFFNQFKYKLGLGYRLSYNWRFTIGMIYQDSKNNVDQPSNLPVVINTNWIVDWGIVFIIPNNRNK